MPFYKGNKPKTDIKKLNEEYVKKNPLNIKISDLFISTQSAMARMNYNIDIIKLFDYLLIDFDNNDSIRGLHYQDIYRGTIIEKKKKKDEKNKRKGKMPNNIAISIRSPMKTNKNIYVAVFTKKSICIAGCKIREDGIGVLKILESFIKSNLDIIG